MKTKKCDFCRGLGKYLDCDNYYCDCPKCNSTGEVATELKETKCPDCNYGYVYVRNPNFIRDVHELYQPDEYLQETCRSCEGKGVVLMYC
jgi:RecJ-like exonuclease